jgi:FixJ family two-component response regulator
MDTARILIVDDDEAVLEALPAALELRLEGLAIDTVGSGTAALQKVETTDYDTIICDVKLPGLDGLALMKRIKSLCPHTPTLLITGHGDYDLGIEALKAGAYAFVTKPIDRNYFIAWVQRALQLRQLSRQVEEQERMLRRQAQDLEQIVQERTAALTELQQRLSRVIDASEAGSYQYSVHTGRKLVDERWARNLGYEPSELPPTAELLEWWEARLHPEDRAEAMRANQEVVEGLTEEYRLDYRIRNKAGEWQWLRSINIAVERDGQGKATLVGGLSFDITHRKPRAA